jgi:Tfp pilus assembly protein PilF
MAYDDRVQLATIYMQSDQMDRARSVLQGAVSQEPHRKEAHTLLGEVYFVQGELALAEEQFESAVSTGGGDPVVLNNLAWVRVELGKTESALSAIDRAIALEPAPLYPYLDTRARVLAKLERREEALTDAQMALSLAPEHDIRAVNELKELIEELEN